MVLLGLLLVALACIVLGVIFASGPWFVASLVASVAAGALLWRKRTRLGTTTEREAAAKPAPPRQQSLVTGTAFAGKLGASPPAPTSTRATELEVWVVDGRPDYHAARCSRIEGQPGELIPRAQAIEDGFRPCTQCAPDDAALATVARVAGDGATASDEDTVATAAAAASTAAATTATATVTAGRVAAATVWVIDGRPRYHLEDCLVIKGQDAEPIPAAQATEDGFMPCSMCEPHRERT